jgi:hypothetical protein
MALFYLQGARRQTQTLGEKHWELDSSIITRQNNKEYHYFIIPCVFNLVLASCPSRLTFFAQFLELFT